MNTEYNECERELANDISADLESSTLHSTSLMYHDDSVNLRQRGLREKSASLSSMKSSRYATGTRRSIVAFSSEFSEASIAISDVKSVPSIGEQGISSLLAACLTANYISVGYLLIPWGKRMPM
jgi:hypothetical protein